MFIRQFRRLADAAIEPSAGSVGDICENALAETINGPCNVASSIGEDRGENFEAFKFATLKSVEFLNNRRLLYPIRNIPPSRRTTHSVLDATAVAA